MSAELGDEADAPVGVAERNEVLAHETDALGGAVGYQLPVEEHGYPVLAEQVAHGRAPTHAAEEFVVFLG